MAKVFLTFDDGPGPKTIEIAEILAEANARATFFLVGRNIERYPLAPKKLALLGHSIGVHGHAHSSLRSLPRQEALAELENAKALIAEKAGIAPSFFRPPYGDYDSGVLGAGLSLGLSPLLWSFNPHDWEKIPRIQGSPEKALGLEKARPGDIILFHDSSAKSTDEAKARACFYAENLPSILDFFSSRNLVPAPLEGALSPSYLPYYNLRMAKKILSAKAWLALKGKAFY